MTEEDKDKPDFLTKARELADTSEKRWTFELYLVCAIVEALYAIARGIRDHK